MEIIKPTKKQLGMLDPFKSSFLQKMIDDGIIVKAQTVDWSEHLNLTIPSLRDNINQEWRW
jgi:hypothetical protein